MATPERTLFFWRKPEQALESYTWTGARKFKTSYGNYQPTRLEDIEEPSFCAECERSPADVVTNLKECEHDRKVRALYVKMMNQDIIVLPFGAWECWGWYKERIEERMGFPVQEQRLIFAGAERGDETRHSGLQANSTVHLVVKSMNINVKSANKI